MRLQRVFQNTSPSRVNVRRAPSLSIIVTRKSSIRTSRPSTLFTVTITGLGRGTPSPRPDPGTSHVCCSAFGSGIRAPIPLRSPVVEWHDPRFAPKWASPAFASPTTIVNGAIRDTSYPPTLKLWIKAATSAICEGGKSIFGIPSRPFRITGPINSPSVRPPTRRARPPHDKSCTAPRIALSPWPPSPDLQAAGPDMPAVASRSVSPAPSPVAVAP